MEVRNSIATKCVAVCKKYDRLEADSARRDAIQQLGFI